MLELALSRLRRGEWILLYDFGDREGEVDAVVPARSVDADTIFELRRLGGLICFATTRQTLEALGVEPIRELMANANSPVLRTFSQKRMGYGDHPAFALWVNHVGVRTGISDADRALTIGRLDYVVSLIAEGKAEQARRVFEEEFIAPGHVPVLASSEGRLGHTELSMMLCELAGIRPSIVLCELLDRGRSLPLEKAKRYAEERGLVLISGREVVEGYRAR